MTPDDFWIEFSKRSDAIVDAFHNGDGECISQQAEELGNLIALVDPRLNVHLYGPEPFRIGILAVPAADEAAHEFVARHTALAPWLVDVGMPDFDPLQSVIASDENGNSLTVSCDDVTCKVLPPRDGRLTILFSLADRFDPAGELGHLYRAVADQLVSNLLGGYPAELEKAVLFPAERVGTLEPLTTLRERWIQTVAAMNSR